MVRSLALERDRQTQRAEEQHCRAEESMRQAEELRVEMLRLQLELERFKKWYCGPRADRLASSGEVAQMLLAFAEEVDRKPVHADDLPPAAEASDEPRTTVGLRVPSHPQASYAEERNSTRFDHLRHLREAGCAFRLR